ncbi:MAG TPA: cation diffusion facilitator family transporter [Allosphingosinicella sp.]|jgi:cation diffusion facilitator family transporter
MTRRKPPPPDDTARDIAKARRLAIVSIVYLCSTVTLLFIVTSGSQALKTEFVGDALSIIPPLLFLVGNRISGRAPDSRHPYGYERAVSAGYLGAALVLLLTGLFLFFDSAMKLVRAEHPSIGGLPLFGHVVWIGWLGLAVLLYSSVPAFFLGRAEKKLGEKLHDKTLIADAQVNEADWQSAGAAMLGVVGIAFGLWWADAAAALFISFEIIRDGITELRSALGDIMDRRPQQLAGKEPDPLPQKLCDYLRGQDWVSDAIVRVREVGREFVAEAFVVPAAVGPDLVERIAEASRGAREIDRRLRDVVIAPLPEFNPGLEAIRPRSPAG